MGRTVAPIEPRSFTEGNLHSPIDSAIRDPRDASYKGLDLTQKAEGMRCTSCASFIERELTTMPGVVEGIVSFFGSSEICVE